MTETMLTADKLEKIMELEGNIRNEYQVKIDAKTAEIERIQQQSATQCESLQATIDKQLATIADLSKKATANNKIEQLNRELSNRSEKLQEEVGTLKKRMKALQKELAAERAAIKALKQFDPARMKKNLDANKRKLAEKTKANDQLQNSLGKTKAKNSELELKIKELEDKLAELDTEENAEESEEEAA